MKRSPFPGMDPYLEAHWDDVHPRLVIYAADALQEALPLDLRARVEKRVFVESDEVRRRFVPDVLITEIRPRGRVNGGGAAMREGGVAVAEPFVVEASNPPLTETFIEVRTRDGSRLVTVIEFLSPANKVGGVGAREYRDKQNALLAAETSLVEIDFGRTGRYALAAPAGSFPDEWEGGYLACITPGPRHERFELYPLPLREPLPALPIPLRDGEARAPLALQPLIDQAWRAGRYGDIDYSRPPRPPLSPDDAAWAEGLLRAAS